MNERTNIHHDDLRAANEKRAARKGYRKLSWLMLALLIGCLVGGYLYLNRDKGVVTLTVASGPYRSDSFELMKEIADVVARHSDQLAIEVIASRDSSNNISLLNKGDVDLATIRSDTPVVDNVRMVADLFPDYFQLITRQDSGIFTPNDLNGKKVAIANFGTDEFRSFWIIGDHYDLPLNGVKWQTMPFASATSKLLSGQVDAIFTVRSLRDRILLNLFEDAELKNLPIRYIPLDQAQAIAIKRPFLQVGNVPRGTFIGKAPTPSRDMVTTIVQRVLVTRKDLDAEPIRELTRILFEHRLDLIIRFALASAITTPKIEVGLAIPLHEGAQQYYDRDEPSFIQENAEPLALMVTVTAMLFSIMLALRSSFVSTQKNRMDSYNYILLDIAEAARQTDSGEEIMQLKTQLHDTLEQVVRALDTDEVTEEGFQTFSFLWESVRVVLKEREQNLSTS